MSFEGRIYQDLTTDEGSRSRHQTFGQGLFAERGRFSIPHHRLAILGLGLLNAALLVAAAVIGIYCANAKDIQISNFAATPLILEMNFLRNHSEIIKVKAEAQAALAKERSEFVQLMLDVKQKKVITDNLEKQIWILQAEKSSLQSNKTALERNCNRCPPEWNILKTSCYYFSQNEAASKKTWSDSRADCNSKGGDLLVIDSLEEQQLIIDYFQRMGSSSTSGISSTSSISSTGSFSSLRGIGSFSSIGTGIAWLLNGYWIGLTNVHQGTWAWINNVTEESTMYWRPGQPSSSGAQSGNCAAFIYVSSTNSLYNENCQHQLNWICEMKPSSI